MSALTEKILNEYEERRKNSEDERKRRIKSVYEKYPDIKKIDEDIKNCGINCMNKIIENPSETQSINLFLKSEMIRLSEKRKELIEKNGVDPLFDKCKYICGICSDTGFTEDNKKCKCLIQRELNEEFNYSNMGEKQRNQTFENFRFDFYSDTQKLCGVTHFERMKKIFGLSRSFTENFDSTDKSLLFYGNQGTGKTFLSSCIGNELMKKGKTVLYARAGRLFDIFERNHFGKGDKEKDEKLINRVYSCDLLIVDDLGTEFRSKNTAAFLYDFFDERMSNNKKMIINTNYSLPELEEIYTVRFTSRIYENFIILRFTGEDIRPKLNDAIL